MNVLENANGTTTTDLEKDYATYLEKVTLTFTPKSGYIAVSYSITVNEITTKYSLNGNTTALIEIEGNTTVEVEYNSYKKFKIEPCGNGALLWYEKDGVADAWSSGTEGTSDRDYDYVINRVRAGSSSSPIDSSIFSISAKTAPSLNGKWINFSSDSSSYSGKEICLFGASNEKSSVTFNSTNLIYSVTIKYCNSENASQRSAFYSNNTLVNGNFENATTVTYLVNSDNFTIENVGYTYLYMYSIEITYSYEMIPITISYDSNGGKGTMEEQIVTSLPVALNESSFTKDGYTFIGWATSKDSVSIEYGDGETIDNLDSNLTLYAMYELDPYQIANMAVIYSNQLTGDLSNIYAYYGGTGEHDITRYISDFIPEYKGLLELQFGKIVYVGSSHETYNLCAEKLIPISQSYETAANISLLDAYLELAYSYYYQSTQLQYDQGSSYQRKIRDMVPEDATELYQKYLDCSTYVSNAFYNAFDDIIVTSSNLNSITTKILINFARDNIGNSNEVILYQDGLLNMSETEKQQALQEFKNALQPGDLYVYRHTSDSAGHVMLYVGNGYFLHSTGNSYDYDNLKDKTEKWTSVEGSVSPEGTVRYQKSSSTVYKTTSTRYLFYIDPDGVDSNDRYALLRPLNRKGLTLTPTTIARCMASGMDIEKSANKTTSVSLGDEITYTIKVKNNSENVISNISVNDVIPQYTTFVSMTNSYPNNHVDGKLIWNIPSIPAGQSVSISYTVKVTNDTNNIGKTITSTGSVGHIQLNTLNLSIGSLSEDKLSDFVTMAIQYYNNPNVYYSDSANNSLSDPTNNIVTFNNGANFVTTLYKRYYATLGKTLDLSSELSEVTNANFMNSIITSSGINSDSKLSKMMVNGGYGGTYFKKDYYMDRMRTIEYDYLLPGDIISFKNSSAPYNQYLYLGDVTIDSVQYSNAFFLFTTSDGVKLISGSSSTKLMQAFIGYNCFAVIRPSLYL